MKFFLFSSVLLVVVSLSLGKPNLHPLSDEFIDLINSKQSTWKAGRNFDVQTSRTYIRSLLGVLPKKLGQPQLPLKKHVEDVADIPESFDSREAWPECADIIGEIRDQSTCGAGWAFGAVAAMSDRICIHSKGTKKVSVSEEDLLSCCGTCGDCNGGWPEYAWRYWRETGIVTGGGYNSGKGCRDYSFAPCDHHVNGTLQPCGENQPIPKCVKQCDAGKNLDYYAELTMGSANAFMGEKEMQLEIMEGGPIEVSYDVYEDFVTYKSGVYQHVAGSYEGGHAVKILGWGVENGTKYWLAANSWNTEWGDNGYFKILRGKNECGIESAAFSGIPLFLN